jgi:very-short-patch-repair endonuclease
MLADCGLPEPVVNLELHDTDGAFVARVDLAYPDARLALEYEGDIHRTDRVVWQRDIARRERVEDLGWRMVRITAADLTSPADLVHRIRRLLRSR